MTDGAIRDRCSRVYGFHRNGRENARRDWGYAQDYVEGMWLILQQREPDDYVFATGEDRSVREFVEKAFAHVGRKIAWEGRGQAERGIEAGSGKGRGCHRGRGVEERHARARVFSG